VCFSGYFYIRDWKMSLTVKLILLGMMKTLTAAQDMLTLTYHKVPHFAHYLINGTIFRKMLLNLKCVF